MPSILYSLPVEWFELRQRFHYLAEHLALRHDLTILAPRSHKRLLSERRWGELLRPWSIANEAATICSVMTLPGYRSLPAFTRLQWKTQIGRLAAASAHLANDFEILWIADPTQADLPDRIPHRALVYECVDDHAGFWSNPGLKARITEMERKLVSRADLVIATSRSLAERLGRFSTQVVHIGNGTEVDYFSQVSPEAFPRPDDLPTNVRIGFYGAIGDWVDVSLLRTLALKRTDWTFVLIGPCFIDPAPLTELPNLHLLGPRPFPELRRYLAHVPVWTIPFKRNPMTDAVDPLKVYEYLAAGRRVVSTALPELRPLAPHLHLVDTMEEWERALALALTEGPRASSEQTLLLDRLRERDWRTLADRIDQQLIRLVGGNR